MPSIKRSHTANTANIEPRDVTVTGADREAAATFRHSADLLRGSMMYQAIRARQPSSQTRDEDQLSRAFAVHRETGEQAARLEGIRLGLAAAAIAARGQGRVLGKTFIYERQARDIVAAILALSAEQLAETKGLELVDNLAIEGNEGEAEYPPHRVRFA